MKQIFLVEDDEEYSELVRLVLERRGLNCEVAYTLAQARRRLATQRADLIILDGHLPDGSGLDLCAELRRDPRFAKALIVVLTALRSVSGSKRWLHAGADTCWSKTRSGVRIGALVAGLMRRRPSETAEPCGRLHFSPQ